MAKRILSCTVSFVLLFIISGSLYANVTVDPVIQSPPNPVTEGVNPVYDIKVTNRDTQISDIFIAIQRDGVNDSGSFISLTDICRAGVNNDGINGFDCGQLAAISTFKYQFQWNTPPLAGEYPLEFVVECFSGDVICNGQTVAIFPPTIVVSEPDPPPEPIPPPGFPELTGLTDSEQEVYESFQSACSSVIGDTPVDGVEGVNNLREACEALLNTDSATLTNAVIQMTPKQGPAQGTTSVETNKRQFDNITSRMAALRSGATGMSVAGLTLQYQELSLPASLFTTHSDTPSGGSAGSDDTLLIGKLGIFINGSVSFGDKASSSNEIGFDLDTKGLTVGVDYRFTDKFVLGGAIGYADSETDFDNNRGSMDVDGYSLSVYSTYYHDENTYLDAIGSVGWSDYTNSRAFDTGTGSIPEVKGDTNGQKVALSIGGGYDFYHKGLSFGPVARINFFNAGIDSYAESSSTGFEFDYDSQDVESLTSILGGQLSYAISTSNGIFTPQLLFEWAHEYKDDSRFITARFVYDTSSTPLPFNLQTDDPDRDYFNLGVGLSATFAEGKSAFIFYETNLQREDINLDTISAGLRLTF